jgi:hypothetical protein
LSVIYTVTISVSALFEYGLGDVIHTHHITPGLELRTTPFYWDGQYVYYEDGVDSSLEALILSNVYTDLSTNWMYTATIQLALNGLEPPWSLDGWSFVPVDLSSIQQSWTSSSNDTDSGAVNNTVSSIVSASTVNVTLTTPAIRGRLECSPIGDMLAANQSAWLTTWDMTNTSMWNSSVNPQADFRTGYELGISTIDPAIGEGQRAVINIPSYQPAVGQRFTYNTSVFANLSQVTCCGDQDVYVGYWSPNSAQPNGVDYSYWDFKTFPANFTVKWIYGPGKALGYIDNSDQYHWIHEQVPTIQALNCMPIIETVNAKVSVDPTTSQVQSYSLLGEPEPDAQAWTYKMDGPFNLSEPNGGPVAKTNASIRSVIISTI